jgi:hypothetical protein
MKQQRNGHKILSGEHKEKIPLGIARGRWDVNIKIEHKEIRCEGGQ